MMIDPYRFRTYGPASALLHFNGSNGGTTFTDELGHSFTATGGTPVTSTTESLAGGSSLLLGSNSDQVKSGAEADFAFPQQWTLEMFVRPTSIATGSIVSWSRAADNAFCYLYMDASGHIIGHRGPGASSLTSTATLSTGTWYHIAFTRSSTNAVRVFVNGNLEASGTNSTTDANPFYLWIGNNINTAGSSFRGYMQDIRLIRGSCLYTASFTAPSAPLAI